MTAGTRAPGDFCWVNIMTPEPDKARNFFGAVLGWTFTEMPGMGHGVKAGGFAGIISPQGVRFYVIEYSA